MSEHWLPVVGYEGMYEVSDFGRVRGIDRLRRDGREMKGVELRPAKLKTGYLAVNLRGPDGRSKTQYVAHLVAAAFLGPRPSKLLVCHNNGNYTDNRAENLRYDNATGNSLDRNAHGTMRRGESHGMAKLTLDEVRYVLRSGASQRELARTLGVSQGCIGHIIRRNTWRHV